MDLIGRQAAINEIKEIYEWHDNVTKERIIEHFERLPSAQPEVIKCKDCRYTRDGQENYGDYMCIKLYMFRNKDDFCSRGERRENDGSD